MLINQLPRTIHFVLVAYALLVESIGPGVSRECIKYWHSVRFERVDM